MSEKPPGPSINILQVFAGLVSTLLVAAILGLNASYNKDGVRDEKDLQHELAIRELKDDMKELKSDLRRHEDECDAERGTMTSLKEGMNELKEAARRQR